MHKTLIVLLDIFKQSLALSDIYEQSIALSDIYEQSLALSDIYAHKVKQLCTHSEVQVLQEELFYLIIPK